MKITNGAHEVLITLADGVANLTIDNDKIIYKFTVKKENNYTNIYQTMSWRSWLFYQSLEALSLLFLAPLLAIALWFLLTQASTTSKYILALASFTVGLVTDEIISSLLHFIRPKLKEDKDNVIGHTGTGVAIEDSVTDSKKDDTANSTR